MAQVTDDHILRRCAGLPRQFTRVASTQDRQRRWETYRPARSGLRADELRDGRHADAHQLYYRQHGTGMNFVTNQG